jgi:hypothetical protein
VDFVEEGEVSGFDGDVGADAIAVGFGAAEGDLEPVAFVGGVVAK